MNLMSTIRISDKVPPGEIWFEQDGKVVGKLIGVSAEPHCGTRRMTFAADDWSHIWNPGRNPSVEVARGDDGASG